MSTAKTTKDKIKDMFLSGQTLTSCGAAKDFITADLRKYITTLKREGLDIVDQWVQSPSGKKHKEYRLRREGEEEPAAAIIEPPPPPPAAEPEPVQIPLLVPQRDCTTPIQQQIPFNT